MEPLCSAIAKNSSNKKRTYFAAFWLSSTWRCSACSSSFVFIADGSLVLLPCYPLLLPAMGKIVSLTELQRQREQLRAAGQTVVFTNGCFDLLHPGHVRYLQQARKLGDALIVALNSYRAVQALKGEARPILKESERAEVMAALACVDYVTIFDEIGRASCRERVYFSV